MHQWPLGSKREILHKWSRTKALRLRWCSAFLLPSLPVLRCCARGAWRHSPYVPLFIFHGRVHRVHGAKWLFGREKKKKLPSCAWVVARVGYQAAGPVHLGEALCAFLQHSCAGNARHPASSLWLWSADAEMSFEVLSPLDRGCFLPDAGTPRGGPCSVPLVPSFLLVST